jgi:integrase
MARGDGFTVDRKPGCKKYRIRLSKPFRGKTLYSGYHDKAATVTRARELVRMQEREAQGLLVVEEERRRDPLDWVIEMYLTDMERQGRSECHRKESRRHLETLQEKCNWAMLADIRLDGLAQFLAALQNQGRSARTLNSYRDTLHTFLEYCRLNRWIEANPLVDFPKAKSGGKQTKPKRALTVAEFQALLNLDIGDRHLLYLTAGLSGLRRNEQRQLQRCDLTPIGLNPTWHLRPEIVKGRRKDVVPMLPEIASAIRPVWENTLPGNRLWPEWPRHQTFDKDLRRAGITKTDTLGRIVSYHSLRYFFCTLVGRVLPIQTVRLLMRHKDIRTTCNLYMDLGMTDVAEAVLLIPPLWEQTSGGKQAG